jgi:hypothetical protein
VDEVARRIHELEAADAWRVYLQHVLYDDLEMVRLAGEELIPGSRSRLGHTGFSPAVAGARWRWEFRGHRCPLAVRSAVCRQRGSPGPTSSMPPIKVTNGR